MKKILKLLAVCTFASAVANAQPFTFVNAVTQSGSVYTLSSASPCSGSLDAKAMWSTTNVDFNTSFELRFSASLSSTSSGADGFCVVFGSNITNSTVGGGGGNMGAFSQPPLAAFNQSIGIEFDVWDNGSISPYFDPTFDHVAVSRNGDIGNVLQSAVQIDPNSTNIVNGVYRNYVVSWDCRNQVLQVRCNGILRISSSFNPTTVFGTSLPVRWGFTSGVGANCMTTLINNPQIVVTGNCSTPPGCSDLCYWKVEGNNVLPNVNTNQPNNIFGTLTDDEIRIQTNGNNLPGTFRGVIKGGNATSGGYFGWNTMSPTARFHVNCANGNNEGTLSDIRFENLEIGTGNILTIDAQGYVHNSNIGLGAGTFWGLGGNTPGLSDYLGTIGTQDLRIKTNGQQRAVFSGSNGFFGLFTNTPTAVLHVECNNPNGNNTPGTSDVRFKDLETGTGNILAIDDQGFVYNTGQPITKNANFWSLTGNATGPGNNIFGTNSPDDVILQTNGIPKGVLTAGTAGGNDDGRLGWQTQAPTAHLHIGCRDGNPDDGSNGSDVRFEELEPGQGEILVIDGSGYVYNSKLILNPDGTIVGADAGLMKMYQEEKSRSDRMEKEIAELKTQIAQLLSSGKPGVSDAIPGTDNNRLYQNVPNPFDNQTTIEYYVHQMEQNAYIMVYDLNGREIAKYSIAQIGKGKITVNGNELIPGVYMYSLIIDGREVASKRMVLSK